MLRVSLHFQSIERGGRAHCPAPRVWTRRAECEKERRWRRREVMGESQNELVEEAGLCIQGGCLSLWIGSGWFTSSGHWRLPLPCCKTSSYGPAWTLGALCPTLAGNIPPKVLLPPLPTTVSIPGPAPYLLKHLHLLRDSVVVFKKK